MLRTSAAALVASLALIGPAAAQDAAAPVKREQSAGYPAVPLLSTGKSVIGETLRYPRSGPAHVTGSVVTLAPGESTIVHKHGVPLFAYILEGELTVDYGPHGKRTYRQGQAFMEAMATAHFGTNTGAQPARLIAVYMGAKGAKDVIPAK